jgi:CubicO group peptidase (beta-lactamase class C family)
MVTRLGVFSLTAALTLLLSAITLTPAHAQSTGIDEVLANFQTLIEEEMDYFNIPGGAVAVISGGEVIYAAGFGLRDVGANLPFTTDTLFRIGSTTKSMTSLIVAQLVDEGLLSWDTPVTDIFPDFTTADPDLTPQITVRDLMGMGTGLVSSVMDGFSWGGWDIDALLAAIASQSIEGNFRESYAYNNEVYALAGYAATVTLGLEPTVESFAQMIQARLFDPVGMTSAVVTDDETALGDNVSLSYEPSLLAETQILLMTDPPIGLIAPSGAVWVSIEDMARYVVTQMNGGVTPDGTRIVSEDALMETWQPGVMIDFDAPGMADTSYGMGWVTQTYHGIPIRFHDGGWAGYSTQMTIYPADDLALIVYANSSLGGTFGQALTYALAELVHDLEPAAVAFAHELTEGFNQEVAAIRPLVTTQPENGLALVGTYAEGWEVEQRDDGSLWLNRGEWVFQMAYVAPLDQYILISGGALGLVVSAETDSSSRDVTALLLYLGEGEPVRLEKLS